MIMIRDYSVAVEVTDRTSLRIRLRSESTTPKWHCRCADADTSVLSLTLTGLDVCQTFTNAVLLMSCRKHNRSLSISVLLIKLISAVTTTLIAELDRNKNFKSDTIEFSVSDGFQILEKVSDSVGFAFWIRHIPELNAMDVPVVRCSSRHTLWPTAPVCNWVTMYTVIHNYRTP